MAGDPPALKVLMLITNLGQGGAEHVFHDHALAFAEGGVKVEQAVFAGDYDDAYRTPLPLHQLRTPAWLGWFGAVGRLLGRAISLRRLVAAGQFDVVISHMDGANWVNALSASRAAKVLVVHGSVLHDRNQRGWRQWLRTRIVIPALYNRAQVAVSVSEGIRQELLSLGVRRVQAIPNFFDVAGIRAAAINPIPDSHQCLFGNAVVLVNCGRLSAQKNQDALMRVFATVKQRRPGVRLLMLGDGERRDELANLAESLGLSVARVGEAVLLPGGDVPDVCFLGYQKNPFSYLARAQLFLLPSLWEGFPLALCEAMACGVPVMSADCPTGPREILMPGGDITPMQAKGAERSKSGVLLPMLVDDASQAIWADAVLRLLDSPQEQQQLAQGAAAAVEQLDRGVILERWVGLIVSPPDHAVSPRSGKTGRQAILMLCPDFGYGGAERSFAKVSRLLSDSFDVATVFFNDNVEQYYDTGAPIFLLDKEASRFAPLRFINRVRALRKLVRERQVGVVISFLEGADYVNYFSGAPRRIASIRGSKTTDREIMGFKGVLRRLLMRFIYPRMEAIVPVSVGLLNELTSSFKVPKAKLHPIPNFHDAEDTRHLSAVTLPPSLIDAFTHHEVWCCVGRLHAQKNHRFLLALLSASKGGHRSPRLAFIGDGAEKLSLVEACEALGLTHSSVSGGVIDETTDVWFLGYQENPCAFLALCRLCLLPSFYEGFPNVLVESMICGVPVVAADCVSGPSEILDVHLGEGQDMAMGKGGILVATPLSSDEVHIRAWLAAVELALSHHDELKAAARVRAGHFSSARAKALWNAVIQ